MNWSQNRFLWYECVYFDDKASFIIKVSVMLLGNIGIDLSYLQAVL